MKYDDLRDFITQLEARGELKRIAVPVDTHLEMTEIADRVLRAGGPALLFERPMTKGVPQAIPVLANLFGTPAAGGDGHGRGCGRRQLEHTAARSRETARLPEGARAAQGAEGRVGEAAGAEAGAQHGAEGSPLRALPAGGVGGRGGRSGEAADPALLARRRRAADHLGPGGDARAAQEAAEPGHLPSAGDRPQPRDHALAGAPRRCSRLPRAPARASGRAFSRVGGAGLRPGDHPRRGDAGAGFDLGVSVRGPLARRQDRTGEVPGQRSAGARLSRDRARRRDPPE